MRFNSLASAAAVAVAVAGLAGFSGVAQAESNVGSNSASASLDFQVVIPGIVFLQVGTGQNWQNVDTVDEIVFDVQPTQLVNGGAVTAAGAAGAGAMNVRVWGNVGTLVLSSTANALSAGDGGPTIPWTEILVAVAGGNAPPHPAFNANGTFETNLTPNGGSRVVNNTGTWTYSFANTNRDAAQGTYTGRVTYTVASL